MRRGDRDKLDHRARRPLWPGHHQALLRPGLRTVLPIALGGLSGKRVDVSAGPRPHHARPLAGRIAQRTLRRARRADRLRRRARDLRAGGDPGNRNLGRSPRRLLRARLDAAARGGAWTEGARDGEGGAARCRDRPIWRRRAGDGLLPICRRRDPHSARTRRALSLGHRRAGAVVHQPLVRAPGDGGVRAAGGRGRDRAGGLVPGRRSDLPRRGTDRRERRRGHSARDRRPESEAPPDRGRPATGGRAELGALDGAIRAPCPGLCRVRCR